jgi:hypothetical protein
MSETRVPQSLESSIDERVYFIRLKRWIAIPKPWSYSVISTLFSSIREPRGCHRAPFTATATWGSRCWWRNSTATTCLGPAWAGDRPGRPKLKLLVVQLAGRPNERRLYGGRVLSLPILGGLHHRYVRV